MSSDSEQRILDGSLWNDFCDRLKAAGALVRGEGVPKDLMNQALGYRYLTRILRAGLESAVDYADPQYPAFFRLADDTKKVLNDNPDNYYENCRIDGRFDYRITGQRGTVKWFSLGVKAGPGNVDKMASTGEIDSSQIDFDADGRFEISMSQKRQPGNWLPMTADSGIMVVRQTFGDRRKERRAEFAIECLNPDRPNNNLDPAELEPRLMQALAFLESTVQLGQLWTQDYRRRTLNALPLHDQKPLLAAGGDPTIRYYQSHWELAPDEALLVEPPELPGCQTWNLQLSNFWMESLEHRFFDISVNKFTARTDAEGRLRIVIAAEDPGPAYPNWLNTLGHDQGGMLFRIVHPESEAPSEIPARVVKLAELRG
ncbi:MAG: DUF1214 domain-containing protein [Myxococcota bacterium]